MLAEVVWATGKAKGVNLAEAEKVGRMFDLSQLKFKDKDALVEQFQSWAVKARHPNPKP